MVDIFQIMAMEDKFYISSLSAQMNGKYLIECTNQAIAEAVRQRLQNRSLPLPHENNTSYEPISVFNGTPIYCVK